MSVNRPMPVVVLKDWVTETKETPLGVECLDQLGEVGERTGQAIDLIDDDHVDPSGLHIGQELLQRRPVHKTRRKSRRHHNGHGSTAGPRETGS